MPHYFVRPCCSRSGRVPTGGFSPKAERGDNPVARGDKPMWATGGGIDFDGRERWERWEALRGTCREDAMLQYVDLLKNRLGPESFEDGEVRAAGAKPDNAD